MASAGGEVDVKQCSRRHLQGSAWLWKGIPADLECAYYFNLTDFYKHSDIAPRLKFL